MGRRRHYEVLQRELGRFLKMRRMNDITAKEFDASILQKFSIWLRDEWLFVINIQTSMRVWMIDAYPVNPEAATPLQPK